MCRAASRAGTLPYAAVPTSPATTGQPIRPAGRAVRAGRSRASSALKASAAQTAVNAASTPAGQGVTPAGNGHISVPRLVFQATRCGLEIMLLRGVRKAPWAETYF
ncbi:hypothetical protein O1M54_26470 [Streptomyces diastatochromogenes]|nr:hypothetical protein [Streptomyces diastatochromogenes]